MYQFFVPAIEMTYVEGLIGFSAMDAGHACVPANPAQRTDDAPYDCSHFDSKRGVATLQEIICKHISLYVFLVLSNLI